MTQRWSRPVVVGTTAGLLLFWAAASPVVAAAPQLILVTGGGLPAPVVLDDWQENLTIMLAATDPVDATKERLRTRSSYRVAMFWGAVSDQYIKAGRDPSALRPEQAQQLGRYYPPTTRHDAVLAFDSINFVGPKLIGWTQKASPSFRRMGSDPMHNGQGRPA